MNVNPTVAAFTMDSPNATLYASGKTFTVNGPASIAAGSVLWIGSTWAGTGILTNNSYFVVQSTGTISIHFVQNGNVKIQGGANYTSANLVVSNDFTNAGTITLENAESTASYYSYLTVSSGKVLTNTGTINVNRGTGGTRQISGTIINTGTGKININTSTTLIGVYTNTGEFNIASGSTLTISGSGQVFNQNGGTLNNGGTFDMTSATFNFNSGDITGTLFLTSSKLNIADTATRQ